MVDIRIGKRIKECREKLGLTQEQFSEKTGLSTNYISTVERGAAFPRCEKLILILNALEVPANAIFCDVVKGSQRYRETMLTHALEALPLEKRKDILDLVEFMVKQTKNDK